LLVCDALLYRQALLVSGARQYGSLVDLSALAAAWLRGCVVAWLRAVRAVRAARLRAACCVLCVRRSGGVPAYLFTHISVHFPLDTLAKNARAATMQNDATSSP
jgi:hypothetical protein